MRNSSCGMTSSLLVRYVMPTSPASFVWSHESNDKRYIMWESMYLPLVEFLYLSYPVFYLTHTSPYLGRVPVLCHEKHIMFLVNLVSESRRTKLQTVCLVIQGCYVHMRIVMHDTRCLNGHLYSYVRCPWSSPSPRDVSMSLASSPLWQTTVL